MPDFIVLLHSGHSVSLSSWHLEPSIVIGALLVLGLYIVATARAGNSVPEWRIGLFVAGWLAMFLALASPIDAAAHRLLSMHMLQHVLLSTIGPPLVLLGVTPAVLQPLLASRAFRTLLRYITNPVLCAALFIVNMWVWHLPPVYEAGLTHLPVHITMHFSFMITGILFWLPVIQPLPNFGRVSEGGRLLYLFATGFPMELLALLLLANGSVLYAYYNANSSSPLWGISPLADQQIAGLIMGALGQLASFIGITWLFVRFLDREEMEPAPLPESRDVA